MKNEVKDVVSGIKTLFGMPVCENIDELSADIAILGAPFDCGSPVAARAGTRFTPKAIREARNMFFYTDMTEGEAAGGWFDSETGEGKLRGITMADCGDVNILPADCDRNFDRITRTVNRILKRGAFPVVLGGDHTTTFPVVRAFDEYAPLDIVDFDAHQDYEDEVGGVKICNATPFRRCSELPFVHGITLVGQRGPMTPSRERSYRAAVEYGEKIITTKECRQIGIDKVIENIPKTKYIYVSLDMDVLDPSIAPGVSFPQPGGLGYYEVRDILMGVATRGKVVGMDIVCLSPINDCSEMTSRVAAELILYFLGAIFPSRK